MPKFKVGDIVRFTDQGLSYANTAAKTRADVEDILKVHTVIAVSDAKLERFPDAQKIGVQSHSTGRKTAWSKLTFTNQDLKPA